DIESFQSGQQATAGSASYSPTGAGVIVHGISATSAGTPVAGTNERLDSGAGSWYGDRIVTGAGAVNVGASGISDPDYAGAIFLAPSSAAEIDAEAAFAAGNASMSATADVEPPPPAEIDATAAFAAGPSTLSVTADVTAGGIDASAAFVAGSASLSATADVESSGPEAISATAAFAAGSATMSTTIDSGDPDVVGPTGDIDPPLFVGALRFRGEGFRVWAGTNEAEIDLSGIATPTWAQVLAAGNTSGANNPSIASGQHLAF